MTAREDKRKLIKRNNNGKLEGHWKRRSGEMNKKKIQDETVGKNDTSDIGSGLGKRNMSDQQKRRQ